MLFQNTLGVYVPICCDTDISRRINTKIRGFNMAAVLGIYTLTNFPVRDLGTYVAMVLQNKSDRNDSKVQTIFLSLHLGEAGNVNARSISTQFLFYSCQNLGGPPTPPPPQGSNDPELLCTRLLLSQLLAVKKNYDV